MFEETFALVTLEHISIPMLKKFLGLWVHEHSIAQEVSKLSLSWEGIDSLLNSVELRKSMN